MVIDKEGVLEELLKMGNTIRKTVSIVALTILGTIAYAVGFYLAMRVMAYFYGVHL